MYLTKQKLRGLKNTLRQQTKRQESFKLKANADSNGYKITYFGNW